MMKTSPMLLKLSAERQTSLVQGILHAIIVAVSAQVVTPIVKSHHLCLEATIDDDPRGRT